MPHGGVRVFVKHSSSTDVWTVWMARPYPYGALRTAPWFADVTIAAYRAR